MNIEWSTIRKQELDEAQMRHASGAELSERDERLVGRRADIDDFIGSHCFYVTVQPIIRDALEEVLLRLPDDVLEMLMGERDVHIIFPEEFANTVYALNIAVPNDGVSKVSIKLKWFVVLAQYLTKGSHQRVVGTIAHELAHVVLEQTLLSSAHSHTEEARADELATQWGFGEEIEESKR